MLKHKFLFIAVLFLAGATIAAEKSPPPVFPITDQGTEFPVNFAKYGVFTGTGTNEYKFKITDRPGLAKAMGTGLYPNLTALSKDQAFQKWKKQNPGTYNQWDHVNTGDPQGDFYTWVVAREVGPGVKLLFSGKALAEAGHYKQALKAFHSVLVNFPREACWSADHSFVWYVANEALGQIHSLTREHPELGVVLKGARFKVFNGVDTNLSNDEFIISPGRWEKPGAQKSRVDLSKLKVINQRGYGKVRLVQYENLQWQLIKDGKPYLVKGVTYSPTPVGKHLSKFGLRWMFEDQDENGLADGPYDTFVDENHNNIQDAGEPAVGDFELMHRMGVNTIRLYRGGEETEYNPGIYNKAVLRDLYYKYGISVIMGDYLGAYTIGSGANWEDGTDYTDPVQLENMRQIITEYVKDHKAEPYVLMWVLGNENLMPSDFSGVNATRTQASKQIKAYLTFVNEIAELIHRLDPDHPVAVGNLELIDLDDHAIYAPAIDIFGANLYRGSGGFGTVWETVQQDFDRPVLITEYGCDAWDSRKNLEDEKSQANYHMGNWNDIQLHAAGGPAEGNSIGGVAFEFIDEWWKSNNGPWESHESTKDMPMAFPDGFSSEEWLGLVSQGDGSNSPLLRNPRAVYEMYRDKWK